MRVEVLLSSRAPYCTGHAMPEEGREGRPFSGKTQVFGHPRWPLTWMVVGHEVVHLMQGPRYYTRVATPRGLRWPSWRTAASYYLGEALAWAFAPLGLVVFLILALLGRVRVHRDVR